MLEIIASMIFEGLIKLALRFDFEKLRFKNFYGLF